ncbi:MAG: DUF421 domain-containing protein [Propionibacteriales bacterium]|nr:DUF421 domain-containing protein [Propionibacteriales bacterium]
MKSQRMSFDDLATAARQQGIRRFASVEIAVLEPDGRVSFFTQDATESGAAEGPAAS